MDIFRQMDGRKRYEEANTPMMKKMVSLLLALCLLMSMVPSAFAAYDGSKPACRNPEHAKWDGQKHDRPQSCWITGHFYCDGMDHAPAALVTVSPMASVTFRLPAAWKDILLARALIR